MKEVEISYSGSYGVFGVGWGTSSLSYSNGTLESTVIPEIHLRRHLRRVQEQVLQILIQREPLIQKEILRL